MAKTTHHIRTPQEVLDIINILESHGFEAYIVGGCVRDSLLHITPKDWDIATNATPSEVIEVFRFYTHFRIFTMGIKYGTIRIHNPRTQHTQIHTNTHKYTQKNLQAHHSTAHKPKPQIIEVTTFRIDGQYSDLRHPDGVCFVLSLEKDLSRRDFSINALAYSPTRDMFFDFFQGESDLKARIIRCVGDPSKRFEEDCLRILRALRFSASLPCFFHIEQHTKQAIFSLYHTLIKCPKERVQIEFNKTLLGDFVSEVFREFFFVFRTLCPLLPNLATPNNPHFEDLCKALDSAPKILEVRMGLFVYFLSLDSATQSQNLALQTLISLKYSKKTIDSIMTLLRYADTQIQANKPSIKAIIHATSTQSFALLLEFWKAQNKNKSKSGGRNKAKIYENPYHIRTLQSLFQDILLHDECTSLAQLAINGDMIKQIAKEENLTIQGAQIGAILKRLLDDVINDTLPNTPKALQSQARQILNS
ncbi:hypothetical protein [uncultured Helicobacter sp.]|uniref:CCA tRNA nucleotidyltransferase n=1 Tax=uncultured Helicobacter sp. TaxID=175537 RepID=UPI0027DDDE6B|nr:hypothetical protein [uncultured Helicobacter sp.]